MELHLLKHPILFGLAAGFAVADLLLYRPFLRKPLRALIEGRR